jgi:hypothetical protein
MLFDSFNEVSNYNALTTKVTKRFSHGFQALIAYTHGKVMDWNRRDSDFQTGAK